MAREHLTRIRIQQVVRANPGIHAAQIALIVGAAWNTTMHHVRQMERDGQLVCQKIDGKIHVFDRSRGRLRNKEASAILHDPTARKVAGYVLRHPGRNQATVAAALGMSTTAIHRRMVRLEEVGLVERLHVGRTTLVHAGDGLEDVLYRPAEAAVSVTLREREEPAAPTAPVDLGTGAMALPEAEASA